MDCLIKFRESQGLSKREMAKLLGISNSFYEKLESGERQISRAFMEKFKKKFPSFDMNIFFEEQLHISCREPQEVTA